MQRTDYLVWMALLLLGSVLGCGGHANYSTESSAPADSAAYAPSASDDGTLNMTLAESAAQSPDAPQPAADATPRIERKIIYQATLDCIVDDIADVAGRVDELVRKHEGFIAKSSLATSPGRPRSGTWTIRVPVGQYHQFLRAAGTLGELERRSEDSREVTAEYYDLETRIRNKQVEEERLLKHLTDSTGKLEDILAVEKELSRVRTEVEQLQGQLRLLADLTALSTITLNVREIEGYVPEESPTFATQISRVWRQSLDTLLSAAKIVVIAAVFLVPWLVVLSVPVVLLILLRWAWLRRRRRNDRRP